MRRFIIVLLLFYAPLAAAQFTLTSGTITDPQGFAYANGTITPTLVISGSPRFSSTGYPYSPPTQATGLDAKGTFAFQLADVNQLAPAGGTWSFHICSAAGTVQPGAPITAGPVCFDLKGVVITGSIMDITAQIEAVPPPPLTTITTGSGQLPIPPCSITPTGTLFCPTIESNNFISITSTPGPGPTCFNGPNGSLTNVGCSTTGGAVSGSGTATFVPIWTNTTTLGNSHMADQGNGSVNYPGNGFFGVARAISIVPSSTGTTTGNPFGTSGSCGSNTNTPLCVLMAWTNPANTTINSLFADNAAATLFNGYVGTGTLPGTAHLMGLDVLNGPIGSGGTGSVINEQYGIRITTGVSNYTTPRDIGLYIRAVQNSTAATINHHYGIFMEDQTTSDGVTPVAADPWGMYITAGKSYFGTMVQFQPKPFANLPACTATTQGNQDSVSDSTVNSWGSTIAGGGSFHVQAFCNGTNWVVMGGSASTSNAVITSTPGQLIQVLDISPCNTPACSATFPHTFTSTPKCVATGHGGSVDINTTAPPSTTTITLNSSGVATATVWCIGAN